MTNALRRAGRLDHLRSPLSPLQDNEVFAVDATSAQLVVRPGPDNEHGSLRVGDQTLTSPLTAGVAVIEVSNLDPATRYTVEVLDDHAKNIETMTFETRSALDDPIRIATISDVHLGIESFGPMPLYRDRDAVPFGTRCAQAALDELVAWGAEVLLIKGDLTDHGKTEEWEIAASLLGQLEIPVIVTSGNHDVWKTRDMSPAAGAERLHLGFEPVQVFDHRGARLILADTSRPGRGSGQLSHLADELAEAANTSAPTLLGIHHNIQRAPLTWFWPPGIRSTDAAPALRALERVNPSVFITSGHTHRNRRHQIGSLTFTEVSATSDYPGVWAGYEITESTIRQTVRRIAAPEALTWTEETRRALGSFWPRWSQGRLVDRCVDLTRS